MVKDVPKSLDSADRGALLSLVSLVVKWGTVANSLQREIEALAEAEKSARDNYNKACEALALYGFESPDESAWARIKEIVGIDMWNGALEKGTMHAALVPRATPAITSSPKIAPPAKSEASSPTVEVRADVFTMAKPKVPMVKDIALAELRAAYPMGKKAADIRDFIASSYQRHLHEKTVGMTLYRLLKEGVVRREGRIWFAAHPRDEPENPGAGAPGLNWLT